MNHVTLGVLLIKFEQTGHNKLMVMWSDCLEFLGYCSSGQIQQILKHMTWGSNGIFLGLHQHRIWRLWNPNWSWWLLIHQIRTISKSLEYYLLLQLKVKNGTVSLVVKCGEAAQISVRPWHMDKRLSKCNVGSVQRSQQVDPLRKPRLRTNKL